LDRFLDRAEIFTIEGRSFRLKDRQREPQAEDRAESIAESSTSKATDTNAPPGSND